MSDFITHVDIGIDRLGTALISYLNSKVFCQFAHLTVLPASGSVLAYGIKSEHLRI